jgi:hypothetical protein
MNDATTNEETPPTLDERPANEVYCIGCGIVGTIGEPAMLRIKECNAILAKRGEEGLDRGEVWRCTDCWMRWNEERSEKTTRDLIEMRAISKALREGQILNQERLQLALAGDFGPELLSTMNGLKKTTNRRLEDDLR